MNLKVNTSVEVFKDFCILKMTLTDANRGKRTLVRTDIERRILGLKHYINKTNAKDSLLHKHMQQFYCSGERKL